MSVTQHAAVVFATNRVLPNRDTSIPVLDQISSEEKKAIIAIVAQMLISGEVALKDSESRDSSWVLKYTPGLVNNWMRKSRELNGNTEYVAKNPGSRVGSGDAAIKSMKALLLMTTEPTARAIIQSEIDARTEALKPKPQVVDYSALPASLLKRLGIEIVPETATEPEVKAVDPIAPVIRKAVVAAE